MGGCVSSNLLNPSDDNFTHLNSSTLSHHFVKLTSTTYGLLNLDSSPPPPPSATSVITPMTPPERFTINDVKSEPTEVINFWELMSGLDGDTCRFSPLPVKCNVSSGGLNKENSDPNLKNPRNSGYEVLRPLDLKLTEESDGGENRDYEVFKPLDPKLTEESDGGENSDYEVLKPLDPKLTEESDGGEENRVVIYTTSLRGVRRTFEACNAVRAAIESFGVVICERDVSMDRGFREELSNLMAGEGDGDGDSTAAVLPPRVFVKGKYIGGAEEVMRLVEEGLLGDLLSEIPRKKHRGGGGCCDGCGGLAFLPCSGCNGSCKVVEGWGSDAVVVKCVECNENGLVRCPICS